MATFVQASTPPPSTSLHTPTTPRFGFDDSYEPYTPRKSTRVSAQVARATRSPPPQSSRRSRKSHNTSPPCSPPTAAKKRTPRNSPTMGGRRVSGALNADNTAFAAVALGLPALEPQRKMAHKPTTALSNTSLLPTPDKTPKKRPSGIAPGISSIARSLFRSEPAEEVMPSPKKKGKKFKGSTLDSFEVEEDQPIQIFTDSNDRVPEIDTSEENPFYGPHSAVPEPPKRASKRRKIDVPGEGEHSFEELERREDGMVYVFRGKKVFRKWSDPEGAADEEVFEEDELTQAIPNNLRRPMTRSAMKPRLLFPSEEQTMAKQKRSEMTEDEEEAITDIEEPDSPLEIVNDHVTTPKSRKRAPATPPTTARTTRSKKIDMDGDMGSDDGVKSPTHVDSGVKASLSPFDNWQRTKGQTSGSKKREGGSITRVSKKSRS